MFDQSSVQIDKRKQLKKNEKDLPPETGASIKTAPIFSASLASSFETSGSIVLESINREPFFTFLKQMKTKKQNPEVYSQVVKMQRIYLFDVATICS